MAPRRPPSLPRAPFFPGVRTGHTGHRRLPCSRKLGRVTPVIEIPEAGHHAMLDQPLLLLTSLRTLLADWEHSEPHRR